MNILLPLTKILSPYAEKRFLLGVSGGMDSMALMQIFLHFRKHFGYDFAIAHFHHGPSSCEEQQSYRFKACEFVRGEAERCKVEYFSNFEGACELEFLRDWQHELQSEADCRTARFQFLNMLCDKHGFDWQVLAHHRDDLLETRLLRMIRGVGPQGLGAMEVASSKKLRPLLALSRLDLQEFVVSRDQGWLQDPSNSESKAMRNWLRNKWLPALQTKSPGAGAALSRSLDLLVQSAGEHTENSSVCFEGASLVLAELLTLGPERKKQVIATYMKRQGLKNYGLSHVLEVLKRLDSSQKRHTFNLLGRRWVVDAGRMSQEDLV